MDGSRDVGANAHPTQMHGFGHKSISWRMFLHKADLRCKLRKTCVIPGRLRGRGLTG